MIEDFAKAVVESVPLTDDAHWTTAERIAGRMTINTQRKIFALEGLAAGWKATAVELRAALSALWDSLSPMERHYTPQSVCVAVKEALASITDSEAA